MTIWRPDLAGSTRPRYLAIADALARDIEFGRLAAGDRLPPQRELADELGVTVTTVTRAYKEAARRGLVAGEVGRGTYVQPALGDDEGGEAIDLSLNTLPPHAHVIELAGRLAPSGAVGDRVRLLDYQAAAGMPSHRAAGGLWFRQRGWDPGGHEVFVTAGAQHALLVALLALLPNGGAVLCEDVTYAGMKELARLLRLTLYPVTLDRWGLQPGDLDAVCRRTSARVLYTMPVLQNPTGLAMTRERQQEVARVAERYDLAIVEDDTYGFVAPEIPPLAALVPDRTLLVTGLSKSVAGGLRVGFLAAPGRWREAVTNGLWNTTVMASPVTAAMGAALIEDGTAARVAAWKRDEMRHRQAEARRVLERVPADIHPASPHVWLPLDRPWRAETFTAAARRRGVLVSASSAFTVREGAWPRAVRVALGVPRSRERLIEGLVRLQALHAEGPRAADAVL